MREKIKGRLIDNDNDNDHHHIDDYLSRITNLISDKILEERPEYILSGIILDLFRSSRNSTRGKSRFCYYE